MKTHPSDQVILPKGAQDMNKMLVAVFDTETAAYEGLKALKDLHRDGDITLYDTAVMVKDASGAVSVKQTADEGPLGTALGMLTGSLVGLLAGPVGVAVGASTGGLAGLTFDLAKAGIDTGIVDEVSRVLTPGKTAILAEVEETWVTPVDTRLGQLGGLVFRRLRSEAVEDQLARDAAAHDAELKQLKEEWAQANADAKAAVQKQIDAVKKMAAATQAHIQSRAEQAKSEMDAKVKALREQEKQARDRQKARIEKRIGEVKADWEVRHTKLEQARKLIGEALSP
jgi:uncharacterized membrane protein